MNVALIGYRGTGKTTVAQSLALELSWQYVDADSELERQVGRRIPEIFEKDGEPAFREFETSTLRQLILRDRTVIATGGGVVVREENRILLDRFTSVIWLTAEPTTILQRIQVDQDSNPTRPSLTSLTPSEEICTLLLQRQPWYEQCSQFAVATDNRSPHEIAHEILAYLNSVGIE